MNNNKLSVLFLSRNDNYNGDNLGRLHLSLKSLHRVLDGFVDWELVLIDYNQVPGKPISIPGDDRVQSHVISHDDHRSFIDKHLDAGAVLKLNGKKLARRRLYNMPYFPLYAVNEGVKRARGEYILLTSTDNIFSCNFRKIVDTLETGYIYRARRKITSENTGKRYFKHIWQEKFSEPDVRKRRKNDKRRSMLKAAGDFLLMDKSSFIKIGGCLPLPMPLPWKPENIMMYIASLMGIPIMMTTYEFVNMDIRAPYKDTVTTFNYEVQHNGVSYNHLKECNSKEICDFDTWATRNKFSRKPHSLLYRCPKREVRLRRYRNVFDMFHSILGDQGNLFSELSWRLT